MGWYCDIAVDDSCRPHISYFKGIGVNVGHLGYATWRGTGWYTAVADSEERDGHHTSIAVDASGHPHISYQDLDHCDLKYARWNGTEWEVQRIDSSPCVGEGTSIAIDDSGRPHTAYYEYTGGNLKYATFRDGEWFVEKVDSSGDVGRYCSLALQFGINPYISYRSGAASSSDLGLARRSGPIWYFEKVDTIGRPGARTSIVIDSNGYPQIAYKGYDFSVIRLARWTGSEWVIETIDADTDVMSPTSLALDSYGFAHIVYSDIALDALRHAYWDGSVWNVETIDGWGEWAGYFNSMAIDKQDNVHVAYCTSLEETLNGYYRLRYAKRGPTAIAEAELTGRRFRYRLFQNSPNPFSRSTKIRFQVPWAGLVSVRIYDVTGREVKVLATGKAKAGPHEVVWNGTDTAARRLPSGVYFCQMKSGGFVSTRKFLLIR